MVWDITRDNDWIGNVYKTDINNANRFFYSTNNEKPVAEYDGVMATNSKTDEYLQLNAFTYSIKDNIITDTLFDSPALYMYLAIIILIAIHLITKSKSIYLVYLPNFLNIIIVLFSTPIQDTRYLYPNLLVFYLLLMILIGIIQDSKNKTEKGQVYTAHTYVSPKNQIKEMLNCYKGTIIIDEAYIDYSDDERGMLDLCLKNERVILFRSFSKKFLASGYRTGYMITKKKIEYLRNTIIPPHSISSYSENFFVTLLEDKKILKSFVDTREYIKLNRELIYNAFKDSKDIEVIKSDANFISILFKDKKTLEKVYNNLSDLAGIQKFDEFVPFIKIWVNNEKFSNVVINRIKEVI